MENITSSKKSYKADKNIVDCAINKSQIMKIIINKYVLVDKRIRNPIIAMFKQ